MLLAKKQIIWITIGVLVILLLGSALVAYSTSWADPVSESFKQIYPAVIVEGRFVSIDESDEFVSVVSRMDPNVSASTAFETFLDHQKSLGLLDKLEIELASDDVSDEFNFYTKGSKDVIDALIQTYFNSDEDLFIENVVHPEVVESKLRIKYNSDFNLNSEAYGRAQGILERIRKGETFEDVAKQTSDDKQSAQFGGDLGFFAHSEILPELEDAIVVAKSGEASDIIITRDGYEIVLPIETAMQDGVKKWHARHILIRTNGFEQWLTNQLNDISVQLLKKY